MNPEISRSQMLSLTLHVAILFALMLLPSLTLPLQRTPELTQLIPLSPRKLTWRATEAGGGQQQATPATAGRLVIARRPLLPPLASPLERKPLLSAEAGITVDAPMPTTTSLGDPLSLVQGPPSGGRGKGPGGLGDGDGPGIGNQQGANLGSYAERWRGVTAPVVIHRVEPDYPEQARQAKFQGAVLVAVEVDEQGRVRAVRVVRAAGLGLDEKAIEAVKQWRFRPATRDGRPVAVPASIEVNFRLL